MYDLLKGLTVVEASSFVASPSAGLYLAQLGAEVIRIDQIGGGPDYRRWPRGDAGDSFYWEGLNRGKRSVALDLGSPDGRKLLQQLAAAAGLFVTNFPVDGFLSHARLAEMRPDLITVRVMGTADGGPALDYTVNAAIGIPFLTGPATLGDAPVNHVLPAWDLLTGAYAAFALLAALRHREATGEGQEVRIPLQDMATASIANLGMLAEVLHGGSDRPRLGNEVFGAFGRDYLTSDGVRLMIMAITPRQWKGLVAVLGIGAEVAAIEAERGVSFDRDEGVRYQHSDLLVPLVEQRVAARRSAELMAALDANGCCWGEYRRMADAARDPALVTGNPVFAAVANPSGLTYPSPGAPLTLPAQGRKAPGVAPALGADSRAVLAGQLGLGAGDIDALVAAGTVAAG